MIQYYSEKAAYTFNPNKFVDPHHKTSVSIAKAKQLVSLTLENPGRNRCLPFFHKSHVLET